MPELLQVSTTDGKYTIIQTEAGNLTFLRHGEPWPVANEALAHSGLVLALAQDLSDLRRDLEISRKAARLFEQAANTWQAQALKEPTS